MAHLTIEQYTIAYGTRENAATGRKRLLDAERSNAVLFQTYGVHGHALARDVARHRFLQPVR